MERAAVVGGGKFNKRRRWMLIGNAVNVGVSTWIGKQLRDRKSFDGVPSFVASAAEKFLSDIFDEGSLRSPQTGGYAPFVPPIGGEYWRAS